MTGQARRDGAAEVDAGLGVVDVVEAVRPGPRTDTVLGAGRAAALLDQAGSRVATGMSRGANPVAVAPGRALG